MQITVGENMTGLFVVVDSRGGNTRKVADAIAEGAGHQGDGCHDIAAR